MNAADKDTELKRLRTLGFKDIENPTNQHLITARMIDPNAWSAHAESQIAWVKRYNLTSSLTHFGAQFIRMRALSLIQAERILKMLERESYAKPVLLPFDARQTGESINKIMMDRCIADRNRDHGQEVGKAISFMHDLDGIPAPEVDIKPDNQTNLIWEEDERRATLHVSPQGNTTLSINDGCQFKVNLQSYLGKDSILIARLTEWIYFNGDMPVTGTDQQLAA